MKTIFTAIFALVVMCSSAQFNYEAPSTEITSVESYDLFTPSFDVPMSFETPVDLNLSLALSDTEPEGLSNAWKVRIAGIGMSVLGLGVASAGANKREQASQGNVLQNAVNGDFRRADNMVKFGNGLFLGGLGVIGYSFTIK